MMLLVGTTFHNQPKSSTTSSCLWSVMIPTYNPKSDYLAETLRSVLAQDPGESWMQIEVLDDCSPNGAPDELVHQVAGNRVNLHRGETNLGMAGVWNHCIERARGQWVHILHQDDVVKPGFYEKLKAGMESPDAPGLVFCRQIFIDENGGQTGRSDLESEMAGCLPDALPRLAQAQAIQTPSVMVRRDVYEAVGGFRSDLCFALDWEMWCRVARQFPVWYEPEALACYRVHAAAATSRLTLSGRDVEDVRKCIEIISGYVPEPRTRAKVRRQALRREAMFAVKNAEALVQAGHRNAAWRQLSGALHCDFSPRVLKNVLTLLPAAAGLMTKKGMQRQSPGNA
ncbi:MAG TPA: glycosyltransferase [Candidatus Acidoferrales bacterium]|nr:glycosyltransferase [Candidatus Acidoferrales bacterium]